MQSANSIQKGHVYHYAPAASSSCLQLPNIIKLFIRQAKIRLESGQFYVLKSASLTVGKLCICKVSFPEKWLARSFLEVSDCFKTYVFSVLGPLSDSVCDGEKKYRENLYTSKEWR